jgi:hypothetical protein
MRAFSSNLFACVLATCTICTTVARADEEPTAPKEPVYEQAGDKVIIRTEGGEKSIAVGCVPRSFTSSGSKAYALCSPNTVVIIAADPPGVLERRPLRDHIVSLTVVDGVVSARTSSGVHALDTIPVAPVTTAPTVTRPRVLSLHAPAYYGPRPEVPKEKEIRGFELDVRGTAGLGLDGPTAASAFMQAGLMYRFDVPFSLSAYGTVGAGTAAFSAGTRTSGPIGGDIQVATGEVLASLDSRFVAFGLGVGVALMDFGYQVEPLVALRGRFGEIDRFEVTWHMSFATGGATPAGEYGAMMEFRVTNGWWLGADAEAGNLRYGRFMVDLRKRLSGNGLHDTVDLRLGLGLAYLRSSVAAVPSMNGFTNETCSEAGVNSINSSITPIPDVECVGTNIDYVGPALSLGLVWRP